MAALALDVQLFVDGVWTTFPAYSEDSWSSQMGPDEESGMQANNFKITLQNDDLSVDPSNPASVLYGKIGRNTPARIRIGGTVINAGEVSRWAPTRTLEHQPGQNRGRSDTPIEVEGLLRRIGKWDDPLTTAATRQISTYSRLGHWPLTDSSAAENLTNLVAGGAPGAWRGTVTLAGDPGPGGEGAAVELGSDGVITGMCLSSTASGWQFCWAQKLPAIPASATPIAMMQWSDTAGRMWYWRVSSSGYQIEVASATGASLSVSNVGFGSGLDPTHWTRYRMRVTVSGGTLTFEPAWYEQDAASIVGISGTFASSFTGQPTGWASVANAYTDGAAFSQVFATSDTTINIVSTYDAVASFNGYINESTWSRFLRLLNENGFARTVVGNSALAATMGRQRPGKLMDLLQEIQDTEGGLIYDDPTQARVVLALHNSLINRATALTLTYGTNVYPPFSKKIDDFKVTNDLTIENWNGTQLRRELTDGALSVQPPPAGVGRYKDTLEVSLRSVDKLADRLNFALRESTTEGPRFPSVRVDLLAQPGLRTTVDAMRPGDIISLAGVAADPVLLRVLTIARTGGHVADDVVFTCRLADVWVPGKYNDGIRRYDSAVTTLNAGVTATATTLVFTMPNRDGLWSSTSAYDVLIAGERVGIPAGGMGAVAGAGPYTQTATGVTRSKNGVVKAQLAGAPIHVANPGRWAKS